MVKVEQVSVANHVNYFKEGIKQRWGLSDYYHPYAPCLFFGVASQVELINNHKGPKILYFVDKNDVFPNSLNKENLFAFYNPYSNIPSDIPTKKGWIETRINDNIIPGQLGDKVFVYLRNPKYAKSMGADIVTELQKKINYEIITLSQNSPIPFDKVITDYYSKSFVSVNFSDCSGVTTVCDLGLFGVKTIMNTQLDLNSLILCKSLDEVPELINIEATKIGTSQPPINNYNLNYYWQHLNFWLNYK